MSRNSGHEGVRGDGGVLKAQFLASCSTTFRRCSRARYAETEEEADQWLKDSSSSPTLLDHATSEVARAVSNSGSGRPLHRAASSSSRPRSNWRLPSISPVQRGSLKSILYNAGNGSRADVSLVMGGVEVDADTAHHSARACSMPVSVPAVCTAPSWAAYLLVFGRRAGLGAADYVRALSSRPAVSAEAIDAAAQQALSPFRRTERRRRRIHYALHMDLQYVMNDLVGIIRNADRNIQGADSFGRAVGRAATTYSSKVTVNTIRAGTCPPTCATCCWSCVARAALRTRKPGTTGTTIGIWTPTGAGSCWYAGPPKPWVPVAAGPATPTAHQRRSSCRRPCDPTYWSSSARSGVGEILPTKSWPSIQDGGK